MRKGINNLIAILPDDELLTKLIIFTDGIDIIVTEKGKYFSAIAKQQYFQFNAEQIDAEIIRLQNHDGNFVKRMDPLESEEKVAALSHG